MKFREVFNSFLELVHLIKKMHREEHIVTQEEVKAKRFELTELTDVLILTLNGLEASKTDYEVIQKGKKYFVSWYGLGLDETRVFVGDVFGMTGYK